MLLLEALQLKQIELLKTPEGKEPFKIWLEKQEIHVQLKILSFIKRVSLGGSKKNIKALSEGLFEIKVDYGPGFRIYFGYLGDKMIILLGGNKGSQKRDIANSKKYWRSFYV